MTATQNEKQRIPFNFLPQNFTVLYENNIYSSEALEIIQAYPLENDSRFHTVLKYSKSVSMGLKEFYDNPNKYRFEIRPVPGIGHGCFSLDTIPAFTVIGEYRGLVSIMDDQDDFDYAWNFLPLNSELKNTPLKDLVIDSKYFGDGWLR